LKAQIQRVQSLLEQPNPNPDKALIRLTPLATTKNPPWPIFHYIGIAYMYKGDFETALRWLEKATQAGSDEATTYHSISICKYNLGEFEEAITFEHKALDKENFFKGWMHLATVHRAKAQLKEALECYKNAVELEPDNTEITYQMAEIYRAQGRLDKALELFEYTVKSEEDHYAAYNAMAQVYLTKQQFEEAEKHLNIILETQPDSIPARITMSDLFRKKGDYKKALRLCRELLDENPEDGRMRLNYAISLQEMGRYEEAEKNYLKALEDQPDVYQSLSSYLMCIHYNPKQSKEDIFEAHKLWDQHFGPDESRERPVPSVKTRDKKLRIGLLSGGFQCHPVGWMITGGLGHLSRDDFEVYCYSTNNKHDFITNRISEAADKWRSVIGYNDEVIAGMIREDEIDILVELSGHAADNRLRTVALEPAPIIVKWVGGLFNTTGLQSVDYLITDRFESPEGEESFYTEKLVRMPDDYISYRPPFYLPESGSLPAEKNGHITFGCFNNPSKVNSKILDQWIKILKRVPDSRLFLKSKQYDTEALRERILSQVAEAGVSKDRIIFKGETNHKDHLSCYNDVDIALDPWPYSGGVTTCEALWMGVPVITKPGPTFAGRHSATHLNNAGFPGWVVDTWEEYIDLTEELAGDIQNLKGLRSSMREQVADSPLCDHKRFAAHLSVALREMWNQRIDGYESGTKNWKDHITVKPLPDEEITGKTSKRIKETELVEATITGSANNDITFKQSNTESIMKSNSSSVEAAPVLNGIQNTAKDSSQPQSAKGDDEIFKIETEENVIICTPADLNLLTPYVLLEQEKWFEPELAFVKDYLQPGMNVLDIGAGFGVYSLPMAKWTGQGGQIFAFEPGPVAKQNLEMSKAENRLNNIEIIGKAVSEKTGTAKLRIADTPELNKLDEDGTEEVSQITLDDWWKAEDHPEVDFIKLDVNGDESKVLNGSEKLFAESSPVVMLAIGETSQAEVQEIESKLEAKGYTLYEYIHGAQLLTPYESGQQADPYLMNLIAIKDDKKEEFVTTGRIYDETVKPDEPENNLWKKELQYPWTKSISSGWKEQASQNKDYLRALDYLCAAERIDLNKEENSNHRSQKGTLMLEAVQILVQLYNGGNTDLPVALTLARGLNMLGKRGQAVEVIEKVMESTSGGNREVTVNMPFMLPLSSQDQAPVHTDFKKWLTVRIVEAWISLKNVSTYLTGEQELNILDLLDANPENSTEIQKKIILAADLHQKNSDSEITENITFNEWFWSRFINTGNNEIDFDNISLNGNGTSENQTPSKIIDVKLDFDSQSHMDSLDVKIPEREVFRLKNIFNDNEYSLPNGFEIEDDGVIVDIGANVGAFAIYAKSWNKNASVYCFEPNPQVLPLLESNTQNFSNIDKKFVALGDTDGELTLTQHPINTGQSTTSHNVEGGKTLSVEVQHAGRALQRADITEIDVLKIDTEGAEVSILKGLKEFLPVTKVVMLEYHTEEDRRQIDNLLHVFRLYSADVQQLWGIGTVKYVNQKLLKK
jgi:FkbM family methyltransferase